MKPSCEQGTIKLASSTLDLPQHLPPVAHRSRQRTLRLAWIMLLVAFSIFCILFVAGIYLVWYYRINATTPEENMLIVRAPEEWVTWQRKGRTTFERAQQKQLLSEGDRVRIASLAGYGQAATVRLFENSTLDMWSGADLVLEQTQRSLWNNNKIVLTLEQKAGYIRYDLRQDQPYKDVMIRVRVGTTFVNLQPGGSYSVQIVPSMRRLFFPGERPNMLPIQVDIAVRSGQADVESQNRHTSLLTGQRVLLDPAGIPSEPLAARWELILDGDFSQYSEEAYNNTTIQDQPTLIRSDTWQINSGTGGPTGAAGGFFKLLYNCKPPQIGDACAATDQIHIAQFLRTGNQTKPFVTGVFQALGADGKGVDISEYRSLVFSIWVRVVHQSVPLSGEQGTECPVMIRFETRKTSPSDPDQERVICFYASGSPSLDPERAPGITYYRLLPDQWQHFRIELRAAEWLPEVRYLRSIEVYANGHDYDARVTRISLVGSHYAPRTQSNGSDNQERE